MILLHLIAKTYGRRPSEIVGIADEWAAYQFDAAVLFESLSEDGPATKSGPVRYDWSDLARK